MKKRQLELLDKGEIPDHIVRYDFNKSETEYKKKLIKVILSGILCGFFVFVSLMTLLSGGFDMMPLALMNTIIFSIPLLISLKKFIPARKMVKLYISRFGKED